MLLLLYSGAKGVVKQTTPTGHDLCSVATLKGCFINLTAGLLATQIKRHGQHNAQFVRFVNPVHTFPITYYTIVKNNHAYNVFS